jgi:uncharacterized protein (TIGR02270 family)
VALRSGAVSVFDELVERLDEDNALLAPLTSALSWFEYGQVRAHVESLLGSSGPAVVCLGVLSAVAHRFDPGIVLEGALDAPDPLLRGAGLEAAGRLGALDLRPKLLAALEDEDDACWFWGAWSAVRLGERAGERAGLSVRGRFAVAEGLFAKPACDIALRALEPDQAVAAHTRFISAVTDKRLGVLAAGIVRDPVLVACLFTQMEAPSLARHAGAALCLVMGRDLRRDHLDGAPPPEGFASSPAECANAGRHSAGAPTRPIMKTVLLMFSLNDGAPSSLPDLRLSGWFAGAHRDCVGHLEAPCP